MTKFLSILILVLAADCSAADTLRLLTFNVRYPASGDGPNLWDLRRDLFVEAVRARDPDLLGTQELFQIQGRYIAEKLPQYKWFGISRRGNHEDEHMGVFYKESRLQLVESGNFWLSETPEIPGSMSWEVTLPRMVTWGIFEFRATGQKFYFYNTHFPHLAQDAQARVRCAQLIRERAAKLPKDVPFILSGDFNAAPGSEAYQVLAADLTDAWTTAAHRFGPEGTLSQFRGATGERRIDWIFYRGIGKVLQIHTDTVNESGRYPSDHYPVFAILEFR
ncbi:MAG: endonuclease/exonuclease/phosphatase family protein [Candidatus Solibacter sp.]|nr:endonuclease/exonuclease/phosphatase family protein [Candidatus Solibacter sp.]